MGEAGRDEARRVLEAGRRARLEVLQLSRLEESGQKEDGLRRALSEMEAAERLISALEDLGERAVLRLRYLEGRRWPQVFRELERAGLYYCERHVYRIHNRALDSAGERCGH